MKSLIQSVEQTNRGRVPVEGALEEEVSQSASHHSGEYVIIESQCTSLNMRLHVHDQTTFVFLTQTDLKQWASWRTRNGMASPIATPLLTRSHTRWWALPRAMFPFPMPLVLSLRCWEASQIHWIFPVDIRVQTKGFTFSYRPLSHLSPFLSSCSMNRCMKCRTEVLVLKLEQGQTGLVTATKV
jgi:hypothetical protein